MQYFFLRYEFGESDLYLTFCGKLPEELRLINICRYFQLLLQYSVSLFKNYELSNHSKTHCLIFFFTVLGSADV